MKNVFFWQGKLQSVNRWHGARAIKVGNKWRAHLFEMADYKNFKKSLVAVFWGSSTLKGYCDLHVTVCASSRADTGNIDKPIGDALEMARIIENDRFIRNVSYTRHYHPNSGSKNKYDDALIIELIPVPENQLEVIKTQQEEDVFDLKKAPIGIGSIIK